MRSDPSARCSFRHNRSSIWLRYSCALAGVFIILIGLSRLSSRQKHGSGADSEAFKWMGVSPQLEPFQPVRGKSHRASAVKPTAQEIVAGKLREFSAKRRELVHAIAERFKLVVPLEVERFFDALEAGRWEEADALFKSMRNGDYNGSPRSPELAQYWRAIVEAWGAAREVQSWPAQKLLDYGQSVLGSLRPGMIYMGGTDPGCFIPTMINETSDGEQHIVFTQNALADGRYQDYLNFLYGDRLAMLTPDDSQRALQDYTADVKSRLLHDQQFPDEPKQVRSGEHVSFNSNGEVEMAGQGSVFALNDRLLQILMQKNPGFSFALEESMPVKSTYAEAVPLGPLMEIGLTGDQNTLTAESAGQSVDFWRATADQLLSDAETPADSNARKAYAHMAQAQANLFADHNFNDQAEQAYNLALTLWPDSTEILANLTQLLAQEGRINDAMSLLEKFTQNYPDKRQTVEGIRQTFASALGPVSPGH